MDVLDIGTAELRRHQNVEIKNGRLTTSPTIDKAQFPLKYYHDKSIISDDQFAAGDRLGHYFMLSNMNLYRPMQYQDMFFKSDGGSSEDYEIKYKEAIRSVSYRVLTVTRNVCCFHDRTKDLGSLREGLNDLVRHFQIKSW